ncbi:MAG: MATE family efflux transporter [Bacteroidaceae bacterium]|nr:MATE family efflux transporter [Bacteroidaceae bacterium]
MTETKTIDRTKELGTKDVGKLLMQYALPAVVAMTASSLYNIVDRIFIGHIGTDTNEGALALSGLAVTFPIMNLSAAFGAMVGVGGSTYMSVKLGQKDNQAAEHTLGNVVTLNIIVGLLLAVFGIIYIDQLLYFFGASENTVGYAREYMFVILLGNAVTHLYLGLNATLRSTGHPRTAMIATISTVIVNSILDPLFIFTFDMGIRGAAIATILAQVFALAFVWIVMSNKNDLIHLHRGIYGLKSRIVKNILKIGLSPFCMQLCACMVVILINKGLSTHGGDIAIAAYGIINGITFLFLMIVMGICQGMQPIAGYNYGAQLYPRVTKVLRYCILYATIVMVFSFIVCEFFPTLPICLFTDDPKLTELSVEGMRLIQLVAPLIGFAIVVGHFFQSIGMAKTSIFLSLSRQLIFLIPFLLIFPGLWGTKGVWLSITVSDFISVLFSAYVLWRFHHKGGLRAAEMLD